MFSISKDTLNRDNLIAQLSNDKAGALVVFEGWVRDHNEGKSVSSLEYQIYHALALKEGERILQEAKEKFNLHNVMTVHREGHLNLGEMAIWIGATSSHRDDAFKATRYVIDEIKHRLPVWKKEHYVSGKKEWVFCRHHHHHVHFEETDYYQKQSKLVDQEKLKSANVLVVGTGGLGCPVLINLAAAGVGKITIVDYDKISISNIHRQTLFSPNLVGERKAIIAKKRVLEQNPFVKVEAIVSSVKLSHIKQANIVVDCSDNMETKYFLHDACFKLRIPLVSASVYKNEGQVRTFLPGQDYGCLRCHVVETPDDSLIGNCNDFGVLGAATSVIGSIQASEIIQLIQTGINNTTKKTFFFNLSNLNQLAVKNTSNPSCATCDGEIELIETDMEVDEVLEGSIFVDIRDKSDEELKEYFNQTQKVILCCHKGVRSKKLVKQFREQGGSHFFSFKGGACSL